MRIGIVANEPSGDQLGAGLFQGDQVVRVIEAECRIFNDANVYIGLPGGDLLNHRRRFHGGMLLCNFQQGIEVDMSLNGFL